LYNYDISRIIFVVARLKKNYNFLALGNCAPAINYRPQLHLCAEMLGLPAEVHYGRSVEAKYRSGFYPLCCACSLLRDFISDAVFF
jgi:hypothetical protein